VYVANLTFGLNLLESPPKWLNEPNWYCFVPLFRSWLWQPIWIGRSGVDSMKLRDSAERRPITILHCDMVNSTRLVDKLDPEEFLDLVEQFLDMATRVIQQNRGIVAGFTGDGIEAYFGYGGVSETPAIDAVSAALDIRQSLTSNSLNLSPQLHCRVGVATGVAVIGTPETEVLGRRLMAFGSVAHLAERLQSAAQPDQVYIDVKTRRMVQQHFSLTEIGSVHLKGFEHNIEITEVVDRIRTSAQIDFSSRHCVPITGRQHIIDLLNERWKIALSGEGQIVHLIGDAGIGKSRVLYEFEKSVVMQGASDPGASDSSVFVLRFQCSIQHASSALHPWINQLSHLAKFRRSDDAVTRREKARRYLRDELNLSVTLVKLCMTLFRIGAEEQTTVLGDTPPTSLLNELQKSLVANVIEVSQKKPVLILLEDVQWIDATSASAITALTEVASNESIFIGVTSRSDTTTKLFNSNVTVVSLVKLSHSEVRAFIASLLKRAERELPESAKEQIVERAQGNPLYIEELTSMMLAEPDGSAVQVRDEKHMPVPMTLQMSLLSRLDRMGQGRELAQIAAVYGAPFSMEQIKFVSGCDYGSVSEGLAELVNANVLRVVSLGDDARYEFRHALLQDAVYGSLLHSRREYIHRHIARELQSHSNEIPRSSPNIIAYHFEWANDGISAFNYWVQAGERALSTGATNEAVNLLEKAQEYVGRVRESKQSLECLQRMHLTYGIAINAVHGTNGNPGAQFKLASELGEQLGNVELTVEALDWQFGVAFNAGCLDLCIEPAKRLVELGQESDYQIAVIAGGQALGMVYFNQGRFKQAAAQFALVLDKAPDIISGQHCFPSLTLSYYAWAKCMLNDRQGAFDLAERAITSSRIESDHAHTIALGNCSLVYHSLGAYVLFKQCNAELIEHCSATGEFVNSLRAAMIRDCLLTIETGTAELLPSIIENLHALIEAGEEIESTYLYLLLAEVQIALSQFEDARESLLTGLGVADENGERFCCVQLNRLMAQVVPLCSGRVAEFEPDHYLEQANVIAANQGASLWASQAKQYKFPAASQAEGVDNELH